MKTNNNFNILIVDDEKFNIELAAVYLKEEGYKLLFALNAKAALESVMQNEISLILLDINMPEVDGFSVCKMLKEDPKTRDIPVIFLTAQTDIEYISQAFEVGGLDYIIKPFNGVELKARVKTHLSNVAYLEEIKHKQAQLAQLTITDSLTKLTNSFYLDSQMKQKQHKKESFWFVFVKIERFEKINNLYGYLGANKVMRTFAKVLKGSAPSNAIVAKLHGASFALLVKNYEVKVMKNIYKKLTVGIQENQSLSGSVKFSVVFQNIKDENFSIPVIYKNAQEGISKIQESRENYLFM